MGRGPAGDRRARHRNPAQVLNLSLGGDGACPRPLQDAIDDVVARGATVVVAAGNEAAEAGTSFPGNCARVVDVGATGPETRPASYSNLGAAVDVMAPGGDAGAGRGVFSTLNTGNTGPALPTYASYRGTSMAAPHVAAAAALLLSERPGLTPAQVEARLKATARPVLDCAPGDCGGGLVDVGALLPARTAIGEKHRRLGGTDGLGDPTSGEYAVPGGTARTYERGRIYRSTATGAAYAVRGAVLTRYLRLGGPGGLLGLPTSDETAVTGGRSSTFTGGRIYWSRATGAHEVHGAVLRRYLRLGGPDSRLGLPTTDEYAVPGGRRSDFARGWIRWDAATGATTVGYS